MRLNRVCLALLGICAGNAWARSYEAAGWQAVVETLEQEQFDGSGKPLAPDEVANATQLRRLHVRVDDNRYWINKFYENGTLMDCLMRSTQAEADGIAQADPNLAGKPMVAKWKDPARLEQVNWNDMKFDSDSDEYEEYMTDTADARISLGVADVANLVEDENYAGSGVEWIGDPVRQPDGTQWNLKGSYENIFNVKQGVLIAAANFSPSGNAVDRNIPKDLWAGKLPDPNAWSDVVFLKWTQRCSSQQVSVAGLTHIFRAFIINDETKKTIADALGPATPTSWGTAKWFYPTPPGEAETLDSRAFYALLYTPNGRGIPWWLVQHKAEMGLRYVDSIAVWSGGSFSYYYMYFHIATYTP